MAIKELENLRGKKYRGFEEEIYFLADVMTEIIKVREVFGLNEMINRLQRGNTIEKGAVDGLYDHLNQVQLEQLKTEHAKWVCEHLLFIRKFNRIRFEDETEKTRTEQLIKEGLENISVEQLAEIFLETLWQRFDQDGKLRKRLKFETMFKK